MELFFGVILMLFVYSYFIYLSSFFKNISRDARVMWDHKTGRSKGYGFVSFRNQQVLLT